MKPALKVHIITLQVLFDLYNKAFFVENNSLKYCTSRASLTIVRAFNDIPETKEAHQAMLHSLEIKQLKAQLK